MLKQNERGLSSASKWGLQQEWEQVPVYQIPVTCTNDESKQPDNSVKPETKFKEFEPRLKFKRRLKYVWFHLKLYPMFHDLSKLSIESDFWRIWDTAQIH